jgi:hypothetical protein
LEELTVPNFRVEEPFSSIVKKVAADMLLNVENNLLNNTASYSEDSHLKVIKMTHPHRTIFSKSPPPLSQHRNNFPCFYLLF